MGVLKIGGLASGLDTDNLIKTLMTFEKRPVVQMQTRVDDLTKEANAWRDLNMRMLTLKQRMDDMVGLTDSVWSAKKASVSNTSILKVESTSNATPGTYNVEVVSKAKATTWQSGAMATAVDSADKVLNLSGTVKIASGPQAGKTFTIETTDTLNSIAAKINKDTETLGITAGVMQVSPGDYRLVITGKNGAAQDFALADEGASTVAATLKLTSSTATKTTTAANGSIKVNDMTITIADNVVKDAVPGTTITLTADSGTTQVTVSKDTQKALDAVKAFVGQYNSVIDFISQQTSYDKDTKKAGTLLGDARINDLDNSLASLLIDPIKSLPAATNSLAMIGVTTEPLSGGKATGKLRVDEAKFIAALEKDPEAVKKLFTLNDGTNKGVAVRARDYLDNYTKTGGILLGRADAIEKSTKLLKDRIKTWNEVIIPKREQHLRDQFTALEKAMNTFQNQGRWLSSQLAQMVPQQQQ